MMTIGLYIAAIYLIRRIILRLQLIICSSHAEDRLFGPVGLALQIWALIAVCRVGL